MLAFPSGVIMFFLEHDPIIHEGVVPERGILAIDRLFYERDEFFVVNILLAFEKIVDVDCPDVCLDDCAGIVECECSY